MKVYIAGPINGYEDTYMETFNQVENNLIDQGHTVVNPTTLPHNHGKTYQEYMREDIAELLQCDAIHMIDGWSVSKGASFEHDTAMMCGIPRL